MSIYRLKHTYTYFSCRGSQSTPGRSSLAACLTSSLSTETLSRCSVCAPATRIHSISGGSTMNGLGENEQPEGTHAEITILSKWFNYTEKNNKQTKSSAYCSEKIQPFWIKKVYLFNQSKHYIKSIYPDRSSDWLTSAIFTFLSFLVKGTYTVAAQNLIRKYAEWILWQRFSFRIRKLNICYFL